MEIYSEDITFRNTYIWNITYVNVPLGRGCIFLQSILIFILHHHFRILADTDLKDPINPPFAKTQLSIP